MAPLKEERLHREPAAQVGAQIAQPAEDVTTPHDQADEEHQGDAQERAPRLGQADDHARPVTLGELLGGGEHHHALRQSGPEHEVEVPRLPGARRFPDGEGPQERGASEHGEHRSEQREGPSREAARLLDQLGPRHARGGHRLPVGLLAPACSVRT